MESKRVVFMAQLVFWLKISFLWHHPKSSKGWLFVVVKQGGDTKRCFLGNNLTGMKPGEIRIKRSQRGETKKKTHHCVSQSDSTHGIFLAI